MLKLRHIKKFVFLLIAILISAYFSTVSAADPLESGRDVINTQSLNAYATHLIRFGLPVSAMPVTTSDYIIIDLPYFTNPTEPVSLSGGYSGTPVYSVISTRIRITGIAMTPGSVLTVRGITAYNPSELELFDVYIRVTSDPDGLHVRNETHIIATPTDGSITVSASIQANVGTLRISGYAASGMFITFTEGGSSIGTCVADDTGYFTQIFPGIAPTDHTILIYGVDQFNRTTPSALIEVYTRAYQMTEVSGIILPPTLELDKTEIVRGDSITISGRGTPGYLVKISTEPPVNSYEQTVDENGDFSLVISDTGNMDFGDHKVYALVQDGLGTQSLFSVTLFFRVLDSEPPDGDEPDCDITRGDLNCDDNVDIVDFSILLYHWGTNSGLADINYDSNVNLIDFSIMMFYWQG